MFDIPVSTGIFSFVALLTAGFVKGLIGMGMPTVGTGLLTIVMAPAQAAGLLVVPNFVTNIWQALAGRHLWALLRRLWPMLLGVCVGTLPGAGFLAGDQSGRATMALGALLVLSALLSMSRIRFRVSRGVEPWVGCAVGLITGYISVATGIFVIPLVPYLQALAFEREEMIQALGLSFLTSSIALAAALAREGELTLGLALASSAALVPAGIGMLIGQRLGQRASPATFGRIFAAAQLLLGLHLALRNIW